MAPPPAYGLVDAYLSHAELRMIKRLAEGGATSAGATAADSQPLPRLLEQGRTLPMAPASEPIAAGRSKEAIR
jgi:hypothetical protein